MLIPNLYTIKNTEKIDENNFKVQIELNPNHQVFEGHFPNNPITPGVCMMQIIKEITEGFVLKDLFLSKVSNVKFMATINPFINPILDLSLNVVCENNEVKVKNSSFFETTNALKFSAIYKVLD
ncbi:3-hydroxyacyl-ACP dehydratase [Empedobacter falsenii]|uniref:3-hydroxyacyl-ACP dehydratase n=1 Tax=Empedobacter falsenii TaxID=343874 RepID=A0AAW7DIH2_9FLAO|nr:MULTISPECIES: 3-hydroxyacyl-ACP dehydratase [Empedobacter]MDM1063339.1 3-hydroxyacyl-ACP dehydratase [Empedobacter falsenii]MDM1549033.1 3-hydroxyacyl-ACP dehydratase [Empedobacter falsenii]MDM1551771.1 3-hydroxyacyl-ACP dehydratase [Empedobacter falsenii]HCC95062.1 3-hydroxyacyl-ACP dehydratase [Flavobacteriaceae bacterium]